MTAKPFDVHALPAYGKCPLVLTAWSDSARDNVRAIGPFVALQDALDALPAFLGTLDPDDETVLMSGVDETGYDWDAAEPQLGETAQSIREEMRRDSEEYRQLCASELRVLHPYHC